MEARIGSAAANAGRRHAVDGPFPAGRGRCSPATRPTARSIPGPTGRAWALLAIAQRHGRHVAILDVTDITQSRLLRESSLFVHPGACGFHESRAVIPAGYQGLLVERAPAGRK